MHKKIFIDLDYDFYIKQEYLDGSSCSKHQVTELVDVHEKYGGFPKSFCLENTTIHQRWFDESEIDFKELGQKLSMDVVSVSSIKQCPGNTIPLHRDMFYQVKKRFPERNDKIVRANIFLEDWKTGHFLQYNDVVDTHWKQGEGHMWDSEILHIGANNGMEDKYTLQISGFYLGN